MKPELRVRRAAVLIGTTAVLLSACGTAQVSDTASPASSSTPTAPGEATPTATVVPSEDQASEPAGGPLSVVACPIPRPTSPACLDTASNGEAPDLTDVVRVGGTVSVAITIRNTGTTSGPVTVLFFTFEPPAVDTFLQPTACNGCSIGLGGIANGVQWSGVDPGDRVLTVTLTAVGRPSQGMDANGNYQWLFAVYAQPYSVAAHGPEGIDVAQAFASGTGATPIVPR